MPSHVPKYTKMAIHMDSPVYSHFSILGHRASPVYSLNQIINILEINFMNSTWQTPVYGVGNG